MKKVLSVILVTSIIGTALIGMSSCGLFTKKIDSGTEAAKLLLANERLDETLVGSKINIGMSKDKSVSILQGLVSDVPSAPVLAGSADISATPMSSTVEHTWTDFPATSDSMIEFTQFVKNVEVEVERVSEKIAEMKNNVGITDKWIDLGGSKQMLRVFENYDVLLIEEGFDGGGHSTYVYYRYTDPATAKNYYEMFSLVSHADGNIGKIRTLFVPNERYEYMYEYSDGFTDYFIAENSRGYWMNTRFNYHSDSSGYKSVNFFPYVIKDGLGFGGSLNLNNVAPPSEEHTYYVFDPAENRELFRISNNLLAYQFDLFLCAIRSGLVSVSSNEARNEIEENVYQAPYLSKLTTSKGTYNIINDYSELPKHKFSPSGGHVQYFFGENIYFGTAGFIMPHPQISIDEACIEFESYAKSLGLELYCDMETVARSIEHAALLADGFFDTFEWNGYKLSSMENLESARKVLHESFDKAAAEHAAVKDYETVDDKQKLSKSAHFAKLNTLVSNGNIFDGTTVKIENVTATTEDVALFENGKEYVLKVGISRVDENNNPIGVNTVALSGTDPVSAAFGEKSITLSAKGEYEIPKNLDMGKYAIVAYMTTKDEGIRVSEIQKIAFVEIKEGQIESSAMHIETFAVNGNLIVEYNIKNIHNIELAATKDSYSYDEIRRLIMIEILTYGAPYHGAVLEDENGNAVSSDASLKTGTYRMMCYLATSDGLAQSYVYLTIK